MTWKRQKHTDLGAAIAGHPEEFQGVEGYIWRSPTSRCFVYAFIEEDGIHVPLARDVQLVKTLEEAEELLAVFVRDEIGESF
jgi:hypothetical protein